MIAPGRVLPDGTNWLSYVRLLRLFNSERI